MIDAYSQLTGLFRRIAIVDEAKAILGWDEATVMPDGGAADRADQLATLSGVAHDLLTAPEIGDLLDAAEAAPPADPFESRNLYLMRRAHRQATMLPRDLVEAFVRQSSTCEKKWREAKNTSEFRVLAPSFSALITLVREYAQVLGDAFDVAPYDALVDQHQPGIASADIIPVFARFETFLRDALPRAEELQRQASYAMPVGAPPFPEVAQEAICRRLAAQAGLDFHSARLDRAAHPFCGGTPGDIRITTRYDEADFCSAVMSVLHETGHALYEAGLPREYARQPVGLAAGMAVHESQSLIIEMQAARSDAYLGYIGPILAEAFNQEPTAFAMDLLAGRLRRVERSFVRVEADELTYPAHVILRFRLERAIIEGDLSARDLPAAWNDGMRDLLDVVPPDDMRGCLQDIHWYTGLFGYFPSYTLGAMTAAQLMAAARRAEPTLDDAFARGDFAPLLGWLWRNVHRYGSRFGFNDLVMLATGSKLDPTDFETHLTKRYLS